MTKKKPKPTPPEPTEQTYATVTFRTPEGRERKRYSVSRTKNGFTVFDDMTNVQVMGPFRTRKDADEWMRTNVAL